MKKTAGGKAAQRLLCACVDRVIRSQWTDVDPYHFSPSKECERYCASITGSSVQIMEKRTVGRYAERGSAEEIGVGDASFIHQALSQITLCIFGCTGALARCKKTPLRSTDISCKREVYLLSNWSSDLHNHKIRESYRRGKPAIITIGNQANTHSQSGRRSSALQTSPLVQGFQAPIAHEHAQLQILTQPKCRT